MATLMSSSVPKGLATSHYVFLRRDTRKSALQDPYEGPFRVLARRQKTYDIDVGGRQETVSLDRLKPAHTDRNQPVRPALRKRRGRPPMKREVQVPNPPLLPALPAAPRRRGRPKKILALLPPARPIPYKHSPRGARVFHWNGT